MKKIMLIDDDPTMLMLLDTLLGLEGFQVVKWSGGDQIYQEFIAAQPDAVLLDVNLRGANGFDILHAIRSGRALTNTTVIMSSGMDYRYECLNAGANDFLPKPYMPDDLIRLLKKHQPAEA
jgi:DNA-binding response OmpR family regulator